MKEEMEHEMMEGMMEWWEHLPDDKKKAVVKAKMEMKMKKLQAKMDFLKEMQRIFGQLDSNDVESQQLVLSNSKHLSGIAKLSTYSYNNEMGTKHVQHRTG